MKVLKFGGTSVGSAENIKKVKDIVQRQKGDVLVVVSALGGITDKILTAAHNATTVTANFHTNLTEIKKKHEETIQELFNVSGEIIPIVNELLDELEQILTGITLVGELTAKTLDRIAGIGERISSHIVAQFIGGKRFDSSELILTDSNFGRAMVDFTITNAKLKEAFKDFSGVAVLPGFISKNSKG